eukprot:gnl/TRDRNA2_/TRDRNA2_170194_c1_seq3.p1 gnl/TRDRNA2_/TRDRNA2_170194_c1~~gnl/TRDRNA2_/TRDRNA2_170194_c1_seq3.p1  ORF type:complete len:103 (-),score=13.35 gnl/TRDRNA2_/TRDRNA2_170194_c1_seq3:335-643(-)
MTFTTTAIAAGYTGRAYFRDEQGFYVDWYDLVDSDVVCFASAKTNATGFHSLIPTAECTYDLPPLAEVKLDKIMEPGTWRAYDKCIQRRLLVVTVTYGSCNL